MDFQTKVMTSLKVRNVGMQFHSETEASAAMCIPLMNDQMKSPVHGKNRVEISIEQILGLMVEMHQSTQHLTCYQTSEWIVDFWTGH